MAEPRRSTQVSGEAKPIMRVTMIRTLASIHKVATDIPVRWARVSMGSFPTRKLDEVSREANL
jgi:hypothetical protein